MTLFLEVLFTYNIIMRNIVKSFLISFVVFSVSALPVYAQGKKVAKNIVQGATRSASQIAPAVSNASARILAEKGVQTSVSAGVKTPQVTVPTFQIPPEMTPSQTTLQRIVNNNKRFVIGAQVKMGVPLRTAVERVLRLGAQPEKHVRKLPLLTNESFVVKDLEELFITPAQEDLPDPRQPFAVRPNLIFRGIALKAKDTTPAVRNILENGLRLQDLGNHAANLRLSLVAGANYKAVTAAARPVTNLTEDPFAAAEWAFRRGIEGSSRVVIAVNATDRGQIIHYDRDIAVDELHSVIILLNVNGQKTWCQVELAEEGFKITPYELDFTFPSK